MVDPNITSKYPIGTEPGIHFLPYLVIVSYIVSLIGAFTTVELLHRRNVGAGWQNWIQLGSCSVSFGLVAIWCMHFIGNRAIILGNGEQEIQLYYSPVFTTVSATLPIVVVFMGLMIGDHFHRGNRGLVTRFLALLITGASAGAAVTGMHYLGNQGTTNYYVKPKATYLVGAATIAIGACIISFGLFFHWHSHWMNTPWRRFMTAVCLAMAVSGMHWTAAAGTRYEVRSYHIKLGRARDVNTIAATCLCLGACSVCFALGILRQRRLRKLKDRAEQVVLAAVMFDGKGRLLVTQSGLMPCQIIAKQFHHKEDLNTAHPVVQWLFRVSRHWAGIVELIPLMRDHLYSTGHLQTHSSVIDIGTRPAEIEDDSNFFSTFRELFCVTAQNIAKNLGLELRDLGQLYDDVLTTGTLSTNTTTIRNHVNCNKERIADEAAVSQADVEEFSNPALSAKGQLLVLTKKVTLEESYSLQDAGYRFAHLDQVGDVLARSFQVSRNDLNSMIAGLQSYCDRKPWTPSKGTYLVAFLLHSSPGLKRMDVIVPKHAPDRLPMVELDAEGLKPWQINLLKQYDGMTIDECLSRISLGYGTQTEHEIHWLEHFCNSLHLLTEEVLDPSLRHATFSPRMLKVAYSSTGLNPCQATVIAFCGVKEIYSQTLPAKTLKCVPFSFFQCQQRAYPGRPDHAILARRNYKEFSTLPNAALDHQRLQAPSTSKWTGKWPFVALSSKSDLRLNPDNSSVKELVQSPSNQHASTDNPANPFGSIMISRDITISDTPKDSCLVEMNDMGLHSEAGIADIEEQTMADELMALTISMRNGYMKDNSGRRWEQQI